MGREMGPGQKEPSADAGAQCEPHHSVPSFMPPGVILSKAHLAPTSHATASRLAARKAGQRNPRSESGGTW
jgi:hypothetical protein